MIKYYLNIILFFFLSLLFLSGLSQKIISGPLYGHTTDSTVNLWLMTQDVYSISITEADSITKLNRIEIVEDLIVNKYFNNLRAFNVVLCFNPNNQDYLKYRILLDGDIDYDFVFNMNKSNNTFLFGSCAYIGHGVSSIYRPWNITKLYKTISFEKAGHMVWMGDNLYLMTNHDLKNYKSIYKRYIYIRKHKDLNQFLSNGIEHYSTWDDHDFGPNNCDGSYKNVHLTTEAFQKFWPNPPPANNKGIFYSFIKGDIEFFMTDSRTFRNNDGSSLLGNKQIEWLKKALLKSVSAFKIIIVSSQVINNAKGHESYYDFPEERAYLIKYIMSNEIPGVLFFSGDRHHSEIQKENNNYLYPIYDITCSALSSPRPKLRGWGPEGEMEKRVTGSFITKHNYGHAVISGHEKNKVLKLSFKGAKGKILYTHSIKMTELGY